MTALAKETALTAPERAARFLRALETGRPLHAKTVALVTAHPDDETIGAGALLPRLSGVTVVLATDGAPRDGGDAGRLGFESAAAYAFARACEFERVMMLAGVPVADRFCLGLPDQEAAMNLPRLARALARLFHERDTEVVLTHSYEGGHPDHDAVAFAVHAAVELRRREGRDIAVVEMPFYHLDGEEWAVQRFVPASGAPEAALVLDERDRAVKLEMLATHRTQGETLGRFGLDAERFRPAPAYDFKALPNGGRLLYERHGWGMTGSRWLKLAAAASAELGLGP
ncbi:MAG TPA: PIG-L family deacetylase [Beijerinckiaceae bacterium]|jgi:LmbE family N-acetylglucosaminyl deacetylase